jgi:hypothetical protein
MRLAAYCWAALCVALPAFLVASSGHDPVKANGATVNGAAKTCEPSGRTPPIPANAPPNSTWLAKGKSIPVRYQNGPVGFRIEFRSAEEVNRICANQPSGLPVCGTKFYACVRGETMFMPNPCDASTSDDTYAGTLCHETAHGRGWPATHGD